MNKIKEYYSDFNIIIKNYSYTLSYQVLSLILPLITIPYVTRVFSEDLVGLNSVLQANCSYFVLIGMLGINLLGPREIAKCLGDINKLTKTYISIYTIQFIAHVIAIVFYVVINSFTSVSSLKYFYLFLLLSSMFDISWFYIGIEDFKNVSFRNVFIKLLSFACLLIFVKSDADIYVYILTLYVPQILVNIYMWVLLFKKNLIKNFGLAFNREMFRESITLFLPQIASNIYTLLDKTILGVFSTLAIAAYYTQGQNILRLILAVAPSFCKVMSPRISSLIEQGDTNGIKKHMKMSSDVLGFLSFFLMFGVLACSDVFVAWYLPTSYSSTAIILKICSPIIVLVSGANLVSVEFLIPNGEQKIYSKSIYIATLVNLVLNLTLVRPLGVYGICIGSLAAETIGFLIQLNYFKKYFQLKWLFNNVPLFLIAGLVEYYVLFIISTKIEPQFKWILLLIIIGIVVYALFVIVLKRLKNIWQALKT